MELLLLSNSTNHGEAMYAHASAELIDVAGGDRVTFVPFALADWDDYADRAIRAFGALGIEAVSAHRSRSPERAILDAEVLMVGGGNSFRLLDSLCGLGVLEGVHERVRAGDCRYMGASAGTNLACPTIATTNDMPICRPPDFAAFALVPFQVNLHFIDADPASTHMGETREERIAEFLEENDCRVLALYEGAWLRVRGTTARVTGPAHVFGRGGSTSYPDGGDVSHLLGDRPSFDGGRRPRPADGAA
ncbi:MAG: dipeptidase PepE [Actinomycetota bacterium]|nr:dipeptidase PepE [Actinomycetota bacterium]